MSNGFDHRDIRDPRNVWSMSAELDTMAELPSAARATGYQSDNEELWVDPNDDSAIYLVTSDNVERCPRGESVLCL